MGVADQAILKIKAMIMAGQLRPGDRLPPEPELAAQIGVSRSSLREAVRALALIQVLEVRRGDGTYVTSLEPSMLMESTGFIVELLRAARELDFFQLRRILEPAAAALAVGSHRRRHPRPAACHRAAHGGRHHGARGGRGGRRPSTGPSRRPPATTS